MLLVDGENVVKIIPRDFAMLEYTGIVTEIAMCVL